MEYSKDLSLSSKKKLLAQELERDPQLKQVFNTMVNDKAQSKVAASRRKLTAKDRLPEQSSKNLPSKGGIRDQITNTRPNMAACITKSPSDSTLYTPVLKRLHQGRQMNNMIDRISNFVEGIHMETDQQDTE